MAGDVHNSFHPSLGEVTRVFAKIGFLSFGGPAGQIALMHRELVEERDWLDEPRFLHALNYCMMLPGPEAMQLANVWRWSIESGSPALSKHAESGRTSQKSQLSCILSGINFMQLVYKDR